MSEKAYGGGPPASPILVRAVELTEDGEWHDYEQLVRELSKMVPPGRAMRRAEESRLSSGGPPERKKRLTTERQIASGKRSLVRDHIQKTWFEVKPPGRVAHGDPPRQIRLRAVPTRVARDRELAARGQLLQPGVLIPLLLQGADAKEQLRGLSHEQLVRLVKALVDRIQSSESNWLEWG